MPSDFETLAWEFHALVERLNGVPIPSAEERVRLLQQMKIVIDQLDGLIWNATLGQESPIRVRLSPSGST